MKTNKSRWAYAAPQPSPAANPNSAAFTLCPAALVAGKTADERRALQETYRQALELAQAEVAQRRGWRRGSERRIVHEAISDADAEDFYNNL